MDEREDGQGRCEWKAAENERGNQVFLTNEIAQDSVDGPLGRSVDVVRNPKQVLEFLQKGYFVGLSEHVSLQPPSLPAERLLDHRTPDIFRQPVRSCIRTFWELTGGLTLATTLPTRRLGGWPVTDSCS